MFLYYHHGYSLVPGMESTLPLWVFSCSHCGAYIIIMGILLFTYIIIMGILLFPVWNLYFHCGYPLVPVVLNLYYSAGSHKPPYEIVFISCEGLIILKNIDTIELCFPCKMILICGLFGAIDKLRHGCHGNHQWMLF